MKGARVVAVSNRVKWSTSWRWFTDFLLDHLKDALGREWGAEAQKKKVEHPVFRWLGRMNDAARAHNKSAGPDIKHAQMGFLTSVFRLGYALYLIEHHDQLDQSLIKQLRLPQQFNAAYYETLIAAAFAVSGASIEMAERSGQSKRTPEFWAVGRSGRRYAVEAKCKNGWKSPVEPESDAFKAELRQWIRDQIHRASSKKLQNPVYAFELSIPHCFDPTIWKSIHQLVKEARLEAENITVDGQPASPAHVFVTNHAHLVNDDAGDLDQVAMLEGYRLETFRAGAQVPSETALEWHDEHRDITWVMSCMAEVERIPSTFDGRPPEFLAAELTGERPLKIGQELVIELPDHEPVQGKVHDVLSQGDRAHVILETSDGTHSIVEIPLTATEASAARTYGDAVFGKPQKRQKNLEEITELYDWFLEVYSKYDKDALLRQISDHPDRDQIAKMPMDRMLVRVAREVTKAAFHQTQNHGEKAET